MDIRTQGREELLALLENILGSTLDLVSLLDEKGNFLYINRVVPGLTKDQVIGTNIADYTPTEFQEIARVSVRQCFATGNPVTYHTTATGPNGTLSHYYCRLSTCLVDGQRMILCVATDITELKSMEHKLRTQIEELKILNSSMIDREVKMAELKSKIETLKKDQGSDPLHPKDSR